MEAEGNRNAETVRKRSGDEFRDAEPKVE